MSATTVSRRRTDAQRARSLDLGSAPTALYARISTGEQTPGNRLAILRAFGDAWKRATSRIAFPIQPMLPTPAAPFHRPGWVYEEKYDGWRIVAYKSGDVVRLVSRKGIDYTGRFGELGHGDRLVAGLRADSGRGSGRFR